MRLVTISILMALILASLGTAVPGAEPRPEAMPETVDPCDAGTPASTPPESAPGTPRQDGFGDGDADAFGMGGRGMGGMGPSGSGYGVAWYPSRGVSGSGEDFGLVRQDVSAAVPVWRKDGDMVTFSAGVRNSRFSTDATLPESHRPFPDELWNVRFGTNYMHGSATGRSYGVSVYFGSASDKPFHSLDEMNIGFLAFLQVPARNERDAWRFLLMYSPVGTFNFPIPGVAYLWNPSDRFRASLGLPPMLWWRPRADLTVTASYVPLAIVNARVTWRAVDGVFLYAGFESLHEAYYLADRQDRDDRFMGFERRLVGGVRWNLGRRAALDLNGGYAFDRYFGVGENQFRDLRDQIDIDPGPFISTSLRLRF